MFRACGRNYVSWRTIKYPRLILSSSRYVSTRHMPMLISTRFLQAPIGHRTFSSNAETAPPAADYVTEEERKFRMKRWIQVSTALFIASMIYSQYLQHTTTPEPVEVALDLIQQSPRVMKLLKLSENGAPARGYYISRSDVDDPDMRGCSFTLKGLNGRDVMVFIEYEHSDKSERKKQNDEQLNDKKTMLRKCQVMINYPYESYFYDFTTHTFGDPVPCTEDDRPFPTWNSVTRYMGDSASAIWSRWMESDDKNMVYGALFVSGSVTLGFIGTYIRKRIQLRAYYAIIKHVQHSPLILSKLGRHVQPYALKDGVTYKGYFNPSVINASFNIRDKYSKKPGVIHVQGAKRNNIWQLQAQVQFGDATKTKAKKIPLDTSTWKI